MTQRQARSHFAFAWPPRLRNSRRCWLPLGHNEALETVSQMVESAGGESSLAVTRSTHGLLLQENATGRGRRHGVLREICIRTAPAKRDGTVFDVSVRHPVGRFTNPLSFDSLRFPAAVSAVCLCVVLLPMLVKHELDSRVHEALVKLLLTGTAFIWTVWVSGSIKQWWQSKRLASRYRRELQGVAVLGQTLDELGAQWVSEGDDPFRS